MRPVDVVVVSDVHLGTAASRAAELNAYLKTVRPGRLVLCGDIVDLWHLRKGAWSEAQTKLIRRILKLAAHGTPVHYVTGNHDAAMRRYTPFIAGSIELCDQLELDLAGTRTWFVHGDVADCLVGTPRWLAWLGSMSYEGLECLSGLVNRCRSLVGADRMSLNAVIKRRIVAAQLHVSRYEATMARLAAERGCGAVVCGHIHIPAVKTFAVEGKTVDYLNSGDWVDSLSALEYSQGRWEVVRWHDMLRDGLVQSLRSATQDQASMQQAAA
jgi:UDP-2,3-diacylglucosamine pyrophosphatase LpxH